MRDAREICDTTGRTKEMSKIGGMRRIGGVGHAQDPKTDTTDDEMR